MVRAISGARRLCQARSGAVLGAATRHTVRDVGPGGTGHRGGKLARVPLP